MKRNKIVNKIRKYRSKYVDIFVDYTFDLSKRIQFLLEQNSMGQKDLAKALGKNESEISKWLSGSHNFTLKTIARIEEVLGDKLLEIVNEETLNKDQYKTKIVC
ncbi:MAG: helix-turn-helix domain-containing protein [Polaribacter sp.]